MKYSKYIFIVTIFSILCLTYDSRGEKRRFIAETDSDGVQRVEILAGKHFFDPDYIIVKVNVPLEIKIKKESGITPHNFVIKEPDAGIDINESTSTETKTIKFTPTKTGKYKFYCDKKLLFFKSHREKGMEGILDVGE